MKVLTNTVLVALLAGSIGIGGLAPAHAAPDAGARAPWTMGHRHMGPHPGMRGDRAAGLGTALTRLGCGDRSAEALEIAFVRAKYELKLDATQQPLLETLRTAALADQQSFAEACKTSFGGGAAAAGTLLGRLQTGLALSQAKVTALSDIVPKFKAFYDSLTTEQQAKLDARAAWGGKGGSWQHRHGRPGMMAPMAPDATPPDSTMQPNSTVPAAPGKAAAPSST